MSDIQHTDTPAPGAASGRGFAIALGVVIAAALVALAVLMATNADDAFGWAVIAIPVVLAVAFRTLERRAMSSAVIGIVVGLVALENHCHLAVREPEESVREVYPVSGQYIARYDAEFIGIAAEISFHEVVD